MEGALEKKVKEQGREDLVDQVKQLEEVAAISAIAQQDGGRVIIKSLTEDCVSAIDTLANGYARLTHVEMVAVCAGLSEKLDMLRTFTRSEANKEGLRKDLEEALQE